MRLRESDSMVFVDTVTNIHHGGVSVQVCDSKVGKIRILTGRDCPYI